MTKMQKTIEKAQGKLRTARDSFETESRQTTAKLARSAGRGVRRESHRAARAAERAGDRVGEALERGADRIEPNRSPIGRLGGYFRRHPLRILLLFGLMTGVVALIAVPMMGGRKPEDEFDGYY